MFIEEVKVLVWWWWILIDDMLERGRELNTKIWVSNSVWEIIAGDEFVIIVKYRKKFSVKKVLLSCDIYGVLLGDIYIKYHELKNRWLSHP
jgi:hypothetical protein